MPHDVQHSALHIYTHVYMHTYIHIYTHAYIHTYTHAYIHTQLKKCHDDMQHSAMKLRTALSSLEAALQECKHSHHRHDSDSDEHICAHDHDQEWSNVAELLENRDEIFSKPHLRGAGLYDRWQRLRDKCGGGPVMCPVVMLCCFVYVASCYVFFLLMYVQMFV